MQDIRLIGLDLDGTVFDDAKHISPRNLAAIEAAVQAGIIVLPATGRTATGVPQAFTGIPGVYVLECGDRIVEGVGEEITTREQWGSFVPANRPGVVTVDWVRDMGCRNVLYHVEAGGKQ